VPAHRPDEGSGSVAQSEATFRYANDRLRETYRAFGAEEHFVPFICECADVRCTRVMMLTLHEFEEARAHPGRFLLLPGHELLELELVVDERERFQLVEKTDRMAGAGDPR
jgi:hypothetical protein